MPLHSFWMHKSGKRKGKPMSQCQACQRVGKGRDPESGLVPINRVWFIFIELEQRIGRAETCRRLGISQNMWMRAERHIYKSMYRRTAKAAMLLLRELRNQDESRHPKSIRYGASARGKQERKPQKSYTGITVGERLAEKTRERWQNPKYRERFSGAKDRINNDRFFAGKEDTSNG